MKKTRMRRYKKRFTKRMKKTRVRKGGMSVDPRVGLPLPLADTFDSMYSSINSLNKTILGNY